MSSNLNKVAELLKREKELKSLKQIKVLFSKLKPVVDRLVRIFETMTSLVFNMDV